MHDFREDDLRTLMEPGCDAAPWHGCNLIDALSRLTSNWERRAAVKKPDLRADQFFDPAKPDFLTDLLPFRDHPDFQDAPGRLQSLALTCGWIAYNEKTIGIESKIVTPACMHVIDGDLPNLSHDQYRQAVSQALVDESYHILLIVNACRVTRQRRGMERLRLPRFHLVEQMTRLQEQHVEPWKKMLIQVACAVVSEVMVSDYLKLLSTAEGIQPLHQIATEIHRRDESAHNSIFKTIGAAVFGGLTHREKEFFLKVLPEPAAWFANAELEVWRAMLQQIDFPNADRIIDDCAGEAARHRTHLDLSTLDDLYQDLGVHRTFLE